MQTLRVYLAIRNHFKALQGFLASYGKIDPSQRV